MTEPVLIPRRTLFGNPDHISLQISPNGQHLAWIAPVDDVLNVWAAPRDDLTAAVAVTQDEDRGIRFYIWAHTNRHLLFLQDIGGDENWHLYRVDLETMEVLDLTPFEGIHAQILATDEKYPETVVVGLNNRSPQWHDLYQINILTGERTLMYKHDRFVDFDFDNNLNPALATASTPNGEMEIYIREGEDWKLWQFVTAEDTLTTQVVGFNETNTHVHILDSKGRDTAALLEVDLSSKESKLLTENALADAGNTLLHPKTHQPQAVAFTYTRKEWHVIDPEIQPDFDKLAHVTDGEITVTSRSIDDRFWTVHYSIDNGPGKYYLYDRSKRAVRFLFTDRPALEGLPLVKMHPVVIPSRDGLNLVSYYSLPEGSDSTGDGIPDQPVPMVLVPHGGPWSRDFWGYNPLHQWLANRGYAVLSVNFRSSTGFGKSFVNAGDLQWGEKIMEDQQDAVRWAIDNQIAHPDLVAVLGGSFGGYSVLAGMTFFPETFACGVDIVGPSNLVTLLQTIPEYWKPMLNLMTARVGDFRTEEGRAILEKHSPLNFVDRIRRPLLIGQGANDPRVKQAESDQIVEAMQAKNIPVTYALYPDEGHGFARPENRISFFAVAEAFLVSVLEGRYEPIGDDLQGSSLQILNGKKDIPGLPEDY